MLSDFLLDVHYNNVHTLKINLQQFFPLYN